MRDPQDGNNTLTYVLPDVIEPAEYICVTLRIPNNKFHIMAFKGAIWDLCNWWNWAKDDAHNGTKVAQVWRRVFRAMRFVDCNPSPAPIGVSVEFDPMDGLVQIVQDGNQCDFDYKCCVGDPWITVATKQDLINNPSGTGNQPQPGGGTAQYCKILYANALMVLPTPVNTGDTITLLSETGIGNDGGTLTWYCAGGDVFIIECTGGGSYLSGGDPVPTANHMSLIIKFSTGSYAFFPGGPFTVPAGIVNEQPIIQVNDSNIFDNSGDYNLCIQVKNNKALSWCHHLDFTLNPYGFADDASAGGPAVWTGGVGWNHATGPGTSCNIKFISGTPFSLSKCVATLKNGSATFDAGSSMGIDFPEPTAMTGAYLSPLASGPNVSTGTSTMTGTELVLGAEHGYTGTLAWDSADVYGSGFDPFAAYPTC